ncbi:MAG: hypothetical protein KDD15_08035 [Lewinella sp.]|nr:hypothetical protein [Lewinella sp.]
MIISHKHKFIFIKPVKVAGTSIELLLSRNCGEKDIITPLGFDPDPNVRKENNATAPRNYIRKMPFKHWSLWMLYNRAMRGFKFEKWHFHEHLKASEIQQYVDKQVWREYFLISVVRNPWDQAVSWFDWQAQYGNNPIVDFEEFVDRRYHSIWYYYTDTKFNYAIDFMIRFESIQADLEQLNDRLKFTDQLDIPQTKKGIRKKKNYKDYYTNDKIIEKIRFKNLQLIEMFNYQF